VWVAVVVIMTAAPPAFAQVRGRGRGGPTSVSATTTAAPSPVGSRQFGSWLDDASVIGEGQAWTALSFGHYRFSAGHENDFPIVDATLGFAERAQIGMTVPFYHLSTPGGPVASGVGDVYLNAKVMLVDASSNADGFGLAITPVIEVQGDPVPGEARAAWATPISFELRREGYRVFGTGGYFSRGALVGGGAIEKPLTSRLVMTGALTFSRSLKNDELADLLGMPRNRADVTAMAAYFVTPTIAVYGGTGRTLSGHETATSLVLIGGLSMSFRPQLLN
jgi:hypothetical protein